jgi:hypothetical protein
LFVLSSFSVIKKIAKWLTVESVEWIMNNE